MIEIVVAAVPARVDDRRSTDGESLIRSACEMLARTSPPLIAAFTVWLPASEPAQTNWLQNMACSLAAKQGFDAAVTVEKGHVGVRFTRRQNHGGGR
jgi:hypothetical protein